MTNKGTAAALAVLLSSTALAMPAFAQDTAAAAQAQPAPAADAAPAEQTPPDIIVTGTADRAGIRKLDASFSISSANAEQIREVQPTSTADLLKIVPGVWTESSGGVTGANVFIRGFPSTGDAPFLTVEMNGSPIIAPSSLSFLEDSSVFRIDDTVERVEVLRGGPSPIFANGQPGATVNFILKKGTQTPHLSLRATYGTEGQYRGDFVAQGPIDENTTYMVGGFYRYSKGLRHTGFTGDLGGQITANLTHTFADGEVSVYGRYLDDKNAFYTPMPLVEDEHGKFHTFPGFDARDDTLVGKEIEHTQIEVGPSINPGGPTQKRNVDLSDGRGAKIYTFGSTFNYDFGAFQVQNNMNFSKGDANTFALFTGDNPQTVSQYLDGRAGTVTYADSGAALAGDQQTIQGGIWAVRKHIRSFTDELKLSKEIFAGNTLTLGGYYANVHDHDVWNLGNNILLALEPQARVLNASLDDGTILTRDGFTSGNSYDVNARYRSSNIAGYITDEWKLGDFRIDGGVRIERTKLHTVFENSSTGDLDGNSLTAYNNNASYLNGTYTVAGYHKTQVSWTAGALYSFTPNLNVFVRANSGALLPQFDDLRGNLASLDAIKPQKVKQYEVGLKTSTALYDLYLTGFYNRFHNLFFQDIQVIGGVEQNVTAFGGSRAYGLEFDGAVRPIRGFQIAAHGVVQNGKFKDFGDNTGNDVNRQPRFLAAVTPSYTFDTDWGRARLFGTYTHVGDRYADRENLQKLGSYDTLDLGASIDINQSFSIQATVENVTNTLALTEGNIRTVGSANTNGYFLGRPIFGRHATITAAVKF
ncbi:MAG: TonB-dependent receptor [Sphingomonas sp.]